MIEKSFGPIDRNIGRGVTGPNNRYNSNSFLILRTRGNIIISNLFLRNKTDQKFIPFPL